MISMVEILSICKRHTHTKYWKTNLGFWTCEFPVVSIKPSKFNRNMCVSEQPNRKSLLPSGFVVWLWLWCSLLAMYALFVLFFFLFFGNIYLFIQTCRDQSPICLLFTHTKRLSDVYVVLSTVSKCRSRCLIHVTCIK